MERGTIQDHVNSTSDHAFFGFAAGLTRATGMEIAPPLLLAREMGTRLLGTGSRLSLHARQYVRFRHPLEVGTAYDITGHVSGITKRRGVLYVTVSSACRSRDEPSLVALEAEYVRAYVTRGPGAGLEPKPRPKRSEWLAEKGASDSARFPAIGSVVEGAPHQADQATVNLFSGPGSNIHTDPTASRSRGLDGAIVQGLMVTDWECELYRDLFGLALFDRSELTVRYIAPMPVGSILQSVSVVTGPDPDPALATGTFLEDGTLVNVSQLRIVLN